MINVSYEELDECYEELILIANNVKEILRSVEKNNKKVSENWTGDVADLYNNEAKKFSKNIDKIYLSLYSAARKLKSIEENYKKTDQLIMSSLKK